MKRSTLLTITVLLLASLSGILFAQNFPLETVIQKGHDQAVMALAFSPDSSYVATGSRDKTLKLWELSTKREVRTFLGHSGTVNDIQFSKSGKYLITSSGDGTAKIWDVFSGRILFSTMPSDYHLTSVAISPDEKYFITSGFEAHATVWDFNTKVPVHQIEVRADLGTKYGTNILFSPDGKWLAIGEDDRTATLYKTGTWEKVYSFKPESGSCGGCPTWPLFSSDSKDFYMASNNGPVKRYKLETGELVRTFLEDFEDDVAGFVLAPDNKQLLLVSDKRGVLLWNSQSGVLTLETTVLGEGEINDAVFTPDGKDVLLACDDNDAIAWNLQDKRTSYSLTGILSHADKGGISYDINSYWESHIAKYIRYKNDLLLADGGKSLVKGKFGKKVKRWDIATGTTLMEYALHEKAVICQAMSKDGTTLATGGGDGKVVLWDLLSGDTIKTISAHREVIFDIQFSEDETLLMTSSWDGSVKLFDVATGKLKTYIVFQKASPYDATFSKNGLYIFTALLDKSLKMWEIDTHKEVREFIGHTDIISSITVDATGTRLLSSGWDGSIRLWDIATGLMIRKFVTEGPVYTACFSPDQQHVYSGGADRIVRMWDVNTGKVVKSFEAHLADITSVQVSPDNKLLVTHSIDGVTKFWDLTTDKEFYEHIHLGDVDWMVKTPDGYFNGTDGARKSIHYVTGLKTYGVDQFFEEFYRPELLPKIFKSRGASSQGNLQGKLHSSPPPEVKVAILPSQVAGEAEVYVKIINQGGGVRGLKLFHNGKNLPINVKELTFPDKKGESTVYKQSVSLMTGNNVFSAIATSLAKVESSPDAAEYYSEHATKAGICHIFSIGINQYKNPKLSLNYAKPDADSFSKIMQGSTVDLFKDVKLYSLYDENASKETILKVLDELAVNINPEDVFIFYYAGHGSMVDDQFFFIPTESVKLYDLKSLQRDAIPAHVLQEKFRNIKALKQLIVMDACHSGASVELLATRGAGEEKAIAQLSRSAGIHVMASTGSEQFATEFAELGHGLFTYVLMKALKGEADGAPADGKVTIYELKSYLDDQVPEMTQKMKGKPQYPYTFSRGHDFPIILNSK